MLARAAHTLDGYTNAFVLTDRTTGLKLELSDVETAVMHALKSLGGERTLDRVRDLATLQLRRPVAAEAVADCVQKARDLALLDEGRSGPDIRRLQRAARKDGLDRLRLEWLRAMIEKIARDVPYYRSRLAGVDLHIERLEDLERLPRLTKADLRQHLHQLQPDRYLSNPIDYPVTWSMSSGTSGDRTQVISLEREIWETFSTGPTYVFQELATVADPRTAVLQTPICSGTECHMDMDRPYEKRVGREPGDTGPSPTRGGVMFLNSYLSPSVTSDAKFEENLRDLSAFRPHVLTGNPAYITALARYVLRARKRPPPMMVIGTTGEIYSAIHRRVMETAFECPVRDIYGSTDGGAINSFECERGVQHVVPEFIVEILAGSRPAAPGEIGRIVVTTLRRRLTPLLRYETNDLAMAGEGCDCALAHTATFAYCVGRVKDIVVNMAGRPLTARRVDQVVASQPGCDDINYYSLVELRPGRFRFTYCPAPGASPAAIESSMREPLLDLLGSGAQLGFEPRQELYPANTGKFRLCYQESPNDTARYFHD